MNDQCRCCEHLYGWYENHGEPGHGVEEFYDCDVTLTYEEEELMENGMCLYFESLEGNDERMDGISDLKGRGALVCGAVHGYQTLSDRTQVPPPVAGGGRMRDMHAPLCERRRAGR